MFLPVVNSLTYRRANARSRPVRLQGQRRFASSQLVAPNQSSLTIEQREPLAVQFTCLFCNHEKAIQVKLDKKQGVGNLHCKVCGQRFQTGINYLSAAVDVYSDWVDACENVAQEAAAAEVEDKRFSNYGTQSAVAGADGVEEDAGYDDDY